MRRQVGSEHGDQLLATTRDHHGAHRTVAAVSHGALPQDAGPLAAANARGTPDRPEPDTGTPTRALRPAIAPPRFGPAAIRRPQPAESGSSGARLCDAVHRRHVTSIAVAALPARVRGRCKYTTHRRPCRTPVRTAAGGIIVPMFNI